MFALICFLGVNAFTMMMALCIDYTSRNTLLKNTKRARLGFLGGGTFLFLAVVCALGFLSEVLRWLLLLTL